MARDTTKLFPPILNSINDLVQSVDTHGRFVFVNKKWQKVLGYTLLEAQQMTFNNVIHRDQLAKCQTEFVKLQEGNGAQNIETVFVSKSGRKITVEGNISLIKDEQGAQFTLGVFRDVSERKKIEDELKTNIEKYRQIFTNSPEAIVLIDTKGNIREINNRIYDWLGYRPEELMGQNIIKLPFLGLKEKAIALKNFSMRLLGKKIPPYELQFTTRTGETQIGRIRATIMRDTKNKIIGDLLMISNVTEYVQIEKKFETIFDSSPDGIVTMNLKGVVTYINRAGLNNIGLQSKEEIIGKHFVKFGAIAIKEIPRYLEMFSEVVRGKKPKPLEGEYTRRDGSKFYAETNFSIIRKGGKAVSIQTITRDISDRVLMEKELQAQKEKAEMFINIVGSMIVALDQKGEIQLINEAGYKILEYGSSAELIGKNWFDTCIPADQREVVREVFASIFENKGKQFDTFKNQIITKSGIRKIIEWHNKILFQDDHITGTLSSGQDITERVQAMSNLERQIKLELLIANISTRFINIKSENINSEIDRALKKIGEFVKVDRSYLFQFSDDLSSMSNTHEWSAAGIEPQITHLQNLPTQKYPWWMDQLEKRQEIYIPDVKGMPQGAGETKKILIAQQIISLIVIPLVFNDRLTGFLGFDSVRRHRVWPIEIITLLRVVGEVFTNAIQRKAVEDKMQKQLYELERLNSLMVGREMKMKELKKKIEQLTSDSEK